MNKLEYYLVEMSLGDGVWRKDWFFDTLKEAKDYINSRKSITYRIIKITVMEEEVG